MMTKSNYLPVGHTLNSCTTKPIISRAEIDGIEVDFVDTPGFDDPQRSDADILHGIAEWIGENLGGKRKVTAALYLHSVENVRMHGSALKNFMMFRQLIGTESMKNVGLITTKWDKVSKDIGEGREDDLKGPNGPWRTMIVQGATTYRLDRTYENGYNIMLQLLRTDPEFVQLQKEMAPEFEGKRLHKTKAGQAVLSDVKDRVTKGRADMEDLETLLATKGLSQKTIDEFQESLKRTKARVEQLEADIKLVENAAGWEGTIARMILQEVICRGTEAILRGLGVTAAPSPPSVMQSLRILGGSVLRAVGSFL
jgi:hypothetical protein